MPVILLRQVFHMNASNKIKVYIAHVMDINQILVIMFGILEYI